MEELQHARARCVAIPGFSTYTLESTRAICDAGTEAALPVILQAGSSSFTGVGRALLARAALTMAEESPSPVGVHLDHSTDLAEISACIQLGYSSVMIDGSHRSFEENVQVTALVVAEAHAKGVWVEAELGAIAGDENVSSAAVAGELTSPEAAAEFVERTGVDALAVAIGSVHGISDHPIHLDLDLLARIARLVSIPLVLHGASGLDTEELRIAVQIGIAKVNFNADLRRAYLGALRDAIEVSEDDVVAAQRAAITAMKQVAYEKLLLLASAGSPTR
ncbi:MAG TPA: class II fructose-bisphosphate aldolase [Acidimicrobiales bacterium]